ncbi:unnamed protein product [Allacma fusca]|uniref:C2H2-type domain-containing protein n=1 Tax=Allacma fusca TaxID=39272 RepID=A0A8J2KUL4_9HEXA|nr:unnamed protein product [Allacma fusca]
MVVFFTLNPELQEITPFNQIPETKSVVIMADWNLGPGGIDRMRRGKRREDVPKTEVTETRRPLEKPLSIYKKGKAICGRCSVPLTTLEELTEHMKQHQ